MSGLPQEIIERDYGCGDPSAHVREGDTVLDLGSGGVDVGSAVSVGRLGSMLVAPLLVSPVAASVLASAQYPAPHSLRTGLGITRDT